ncbi:MAG: type 1 glutamine amidotransferase [Solirubrobacteraceae bacterium]
MPRPFLVLQHIACEPPGAYEDELIAWGGELHRVEVDAGEPLPDWRPYAGIIAMGGPMGAYEDSEHPWLADEKRLIADAVRGGMPYWGVCLGAQLLAASLGARVYPGGGAEVGVLDVELTAEAATDAVFADAPRRFPALQWHGDTWGLPAGATRLARSEAYEQQAFVFKRAYGAQFHVEVSSGLASEWGHVPAYSRSLEAILGPGALPRLIDDVAASETEMVGLARRLFRAWLDRVVTPAEQALAPV